MKKDIGVYIVSLANAIERRNHIDYQFKKYNINYEFIDGIVGADLSGAVLASANRSNTSSRYNRNIVPGEIGCSLSHQSIYKKMIDSDIEWGFIFEDDVIIDEQLPLLINYDLDNFPSNALYLLGGQEGLKGQVMVATSIWARIKIADSIVFKKTIRSSRYLYRTCAYLIHITTAKKLYAEYRENYFLADDWSYLLKNECFKGIYLTDLVKHPTDLSSSTIEQGRESSLSISNRADNNRFIFNDTLRKIKSIFRCIYRLGW